MAIGNGGQRGRLGLVGTAVTLVAAAALAACSTTSPAAVHGATTVPPTTTTSTTASTTTTDPGLLPQTPDKPSASGPVFDTGVNDLWSAVQTDDPQKAMPFFFPLTAYVQVKAISNPESDWHNRLVAAYDRDIHSLHLSLGPNASQAQLVGIDVPSSRAQWITPGVESNKGSYWRVYGTRIRYTVNGQPQSFAVASLISWRGEWYVVHLSSVG